MNPRVKLLYFIGGQRRWVCRSKLNIGFGDTPAKAYEHWAESMWESGQW